VPRWVGGSGSTTRSDLWMPWRARGLERRMSGRALWIVSLALRARSVRRCVLGCCMTKGGGSRPMMVGRRSMFLDRLGKVDRAFVLYWGEEFG